MSTDNISLGGAGPGAAGWRGLPPAVWAHGLGLLLLLIGGLLLLAAAAGIAAALAWLGGMAALLGAGVSIWAWRRGPGVATGGAHDALMQAALDVPATALAITQADGALVRANKAYRQLLGGYPSPVRLDPAGEAAREARICGQGQVEAFAGEQTLVVTARRFQQAPDHLIWEVVPLAVGPGDESFLQQCRLLLAPWLERLDIALLLTDRQGRIVFASPLAKRWGDGQAVAGAALEGVLHRRAKGDHGFGAAAQAMPVRAEQIPLPGGVGQVVLLRRAEAAGNAAIEAVQAPHAPGEGISRHVFSAAPIGMALLDEKGDVLRANKVLRQLAAIDDQRADFNLTDVLVDADKAAAKALLEAVGKGAGNQKPVDVHFAAAPEVVSQLFATPVPDGAGEMILFVKDTTEQKRLELQFAQAQKMQAIGQLAGGIAHDFNNILTAIIGFCDLLTVRHNAGDASFSDIMQIKQNANRAANLVRQLLAFSRKQTLRPSVIDITDALAELHNLLRRLIGENIELKMQHGRNLGAIKVDQGQLEQVIINLAVNARDAMPGGGTLTITTSRIEASDVAALGHEIMPSGDYIALEVRDTGQGIPKENLQKIFEPFFTTKEVGRGTGLGLSTVYGIVKQTGGFIFATSEPGEGAAFTIYLPVHVPTPDERPQVAERKSEDVADLWGRGTILLVEDEDPVRTFATRALGKKGYTVLEAASGEAALDLVRRHDGTIDLVVSDVVMPNMDGPTLVQEIRKLMPTVKVIFISGYAQDGFRDQLADGSYGFLPKPFSLSQLAEAVKGALVGEAEQAQ
ncbi:MAG: PAS domain-containing sensor histidine kinase [Sphingomonadales bacterium]